jgi:cobalt-zinc-cadmium resistance protein CzcA
VPGNQDVYTVRTMACSTCASWSTVGGRYGLSVEDVQDALRVQIEGQRAGTVIDGNRRIPIVLRADGVKVSPAEFAALHITTPTDRGAAAGAGALERDGAR